LKTHHLFFSLLILLFSTTALAQNLENQCTSDVYKTVSRQLKINAKAVSSDCKMWPHQSNLLLIAIAYDQGKEYEKNLIVATLDHKKRKIISSTKRIIDEDASMEIGEHSLKLDTARYQLSPNVRAFGVRIHSVAHGANCGTGYSNDELTLFVPEGKVLRSVLSLNMWQQQWIEGCPAVSQSLWEDAALTFSTSTSSNHGYYDLVLKARITVNTEGLGKANLKDRTEHAVLRYDGKFYQKEKVVPWWLEY
jgi:hypothetical protein